MLQRGLEFAMENENKLICHICQKKFICVSTKNRHLRTMHNEKVEERKSQHIKCPICAEERKEPLANHDSLIQHLTKVHGLSIEQCNLNFRNMEEFKAWRTLEDTERDYAYTTSVNHHNGEKLIYYNCNRSNSKGFKSNCTKRAMKTGGSIRICGICPSRIRAKIYQNGTINVQFIKTHVGHEDELRTKRLTQKEQALIVEQLRAGISDDRILEDARKVRDNQLERLNLIKKADLRNLKRRFNIDKKRDPDDVVAKVLKVEKNPEEYLCIEEPSTRDETCKTENKGNELISLKRRKKTLIADFANFVNNLDREQLEKLTGIMTELKKNFEQERISYAEREK
jgi:hypothetical protein